MRERHRLRSSQDFTHVLRAGSAVARPEFVLYHSRRNGQSRSRFGFVVSRRIGGAVVRNRVKRLLREAARALEPLMDAPTDVVVVARSEILAATMPEVRRALELAAASAGLTRIRPAREGTST